MDGLLFLYNLKLKHLLDILKVVSGSYIAACITCPNVSETRYVLNHMVIIFQDSARHTAHTSGRDLFWELSKLQKATAIETAKRAPDGKTLPNISTQCFVLAFGYRLLWW